MLIPFLFLLKQLFLYKILNYQFGYINGADWYRSINCFYLIYKR